MHKSVCYALSLTLIFVSLIPDSRTNEYQAGETKVLVIVKRFPDPGVCDTFQHIILELISDRKRYSEVYLYPEVLDTSEPLKATRLKPFVKAPQNERTEVDLVVVIGGDGTLIHANTIFQGGKMPFFLACSEGSLGFLAAYKRLPGGATLLPEKGEVTIRMRLHCSVYKNVDAAAIEKWQYRSQSSPSDSILQSDGSQPTPSSAFRVLNELTLYRKAGRPLPKFMIYVGKDLIGSVRANGLLVSTPTGSTAYQAGAGGPLVFPDLRVTLIVAIDPVSPFDYIALPSEVKIQIKCDSTVDILYDGKPQGEDTELGEENAVFIEECEDDFKVVCKQNTLADWFDALDASFHWNTFIGKTEPVQLKPYDKGLRLNGSDESAKTELVRNACEITIRNTRPCTLKLSINTKHLATVTAAALVVASPASSMGYSAFAGGILIHPSIPAIQLVAINPTTPFKPVVLPGDVVFTITSDHEFNVFVDEKVDSIYKVKDVNPVGRSSKLTIRAAQISTLDAELDAIESWAEFLKTYGWNNRINQKKTEGKLEDLTAGLVDKIPQKFMQKS